MAYDGSLKFDSKIDTKGFAKGVNTLNAQANGLSGTFKKLGVTIAAAFVVKKAFDIGKQAVSFASDLQEVQNVVDTAFGEMSYKMEEFAKTSIETFGISKLAAKKTGSTFMAMSVGMGIAKSSASDMALSLTGLSADMSSFYNVTQDVASTALKSIFTGETETLKQFGIVMTEANLQAFAYSQGITKQVSAMSQAEKVQLRYNFVMEQTKLAQGDFEKTSGSWANQTRMLSEKWKEFLSIIGNGLVNVILPVVRALNTAMSSLISFADSASKALSNVFGKSKQTESVTKGISTGLESSATSADELASSVEKAGKKAKRSLAAFDELNTISSGEIGGESAGGLSSTEPMSLGLEDDTKKETDEAKSNLQLFIENALSGFDKFKSYLSKEFSPIFSTIFDGLSKEAGEFKKSFGSVFEDIKSLWKPFLSYLNSSFVPYLKTVFSVIGDILVGTFDSFNMVFADIWNVAIFPLLEKLVTIFLPMITDIATKTWEITGALFEQGKRIFDLLWSEALVPLLDRVTKIINDIIDLLAEFWNKWGKPITDNIKEAIKKIGDLFITVWQSFFKPVFDNFMEMIDWLWEKHLEPFVANFLDFVGEFVNGASEIYNKFILPLVTAFVETFGPAISTVFNTVGNVIGIVIAGAIDVLNGIITSLKGVIQFIVGAFTGDWRKAWEGVKNIFKGIWDSLVGIVKAPINLIIDAVNFMVGSVIDGLNFVIGAINKLSFEVPDFVPEIGGKTFGFNISAINKADYKIPKLATGAVIPPNSEFLAILGDQKRGMNIETPLATMIEAFETALNKRGNDNNGGTTVILEIDGNEFGRAVYKANKSESRRVGTQIVMQGG